MSTQIAPVPAAQPIRQRLRLGDAPVTGYEKARERLAWALVAPSILVVGVVALYPLFETFRLSFTNARLASLEEPQYVGLANYRLLFDNPAFVDAIWTTIQFTITSVTIETVLGMIIALVINSNFRGRGMVRAAMLVPWAIPTVVSATMWQWMYHDVFGVVNDLFDRIGIISSNVAWMANPATAMSAMVAVDVWKTTPFMALLLLAGLQIIPNDVYEASTVDGANKWQQFWQITLPMVKPALMVALIFRTLDAFRIFDLPFVLNPNSPLVTTLAVYARNNLVAFSLLGVGSAVAVVIFLCILVLVIIYARLVRVED